MQIPTHRPSARVTAYEPPAATPETSDSNWFSASIASPPVPETPPTASALARSSNFLGSLSSRAGNDLQRLSKSSDPMDIVAATRSLSSLSTQVSLAAKIVNKSVQAVEKLTNLS